MAITVRPLSVSEADRKRQAGVGPIGVVAAASSDTSPAIPSDAEQRRIGFGLRMLLVRLRVMMGEEA